MGWLQDPLPLPFPPDHRPAWTRDLVTAEIVGGGVSPGVIESMPAIDVIQVIRSLADEPDVTIIISGSDRAAGEIMIAISDGNYFLGLFTPDGRVYQYTRNEQLNDRIIFTIEGEVTEIESRWVVDAPAATTAVLEWLAVGREAASSGDWIKV